MTTVTESAYIATLHMKLAQAERSLNEFRKIFEHYQRGLEMENHKSNLVRAPAGSCEIQRDPAPYECDD